MFERLALFIFAVLSAIAFAYSAAINLWTFAADPPEARFPGFEILQFGIFPVVGGAAILAAYLMRQTRSREWGESLFVRIPIVLRFAILGFSLYAMALSFEQTMLGDVGVPAIRDGQYVLHNHGTIVRVLTAEGYAIEEAGSARVSTAFHMAFYVVALALAIGGLRMLAGTKPVAQSPVESEAPVAELPVSKSRPVWRT